MVNSCTTGAKEDKKTYTNVVTMYTVLTKINKS